MQTSSLASHTLCLITMLGISCLRDNGQSKKNWKNFPVRVAPHQVDKRFWLVLAVTAEEVQTHIKNVLSQVHLQILAVGNMYKDEAIKISETVEKGLGRSLLSPDELHERALLLHPGKFLSRPQVRYWILHSWRIEFGPFCTPAQSQSSQFRLDLFHLLWTSMRSENACNLGASDPDVERTSVQRSANSRTTWLPCLLYQLDFVWVEWKGAPYCCPKWEEAWVPGGTSRGVLRWDEDQAWDNDWWRIHFPSQWFREEMAGGW